MRLTVRESIIVISLGFKLLALVFNLQRKQRNKSLHVHKVRKNKGMKKSFPPHYHVQTAFPTAVTA